MAAIIAVLDACVLVPAALRDSLLYTAAAGLYRPRWSDMILEEVVRTLTTNGLATTTQVRSLIAKLRFHFPEAMTVGHESLVPAMTNHSKDRHVLAVAVASDARLIVTSNLRDFPPAALAPHGVEAQHPDTFLSDLYERDPALVVSLVQHQAAALSRPPQPLAHVLRHLGRHAPTFAAHVRAAAGIALERE